MNRAASRTAASRAAASGGWRWLWIAVGVVVLDQAAKHWVLAALRPGDEIVLAPFASVVLAFNTGAAFSFLAGAAGWQRWMFASIAVVACVVLAWLLRRGGSALYCAGLALIIGGALGNLYDRLTLGQVVDFVLLHYRHWYYPAFNVADSAITVGAAAIIVDSLRPRGRAHAGDEGRS